MRNGSRKRPSQFEVPRDQMVAEGPRNSRRPRAGPLKLMPTRAETLARAAMPCATGFEAAGARCPLKRRSCNRRRLLLDLYGEDIRARAYVTSDALRGEQMLRPDFTVPVVQMHMAERGGARALHLCGGGLSPTRG